MIRFLALVVLDTAGIVLTVDCTARFLATNPELAGVAAAGRFMLSNATDKTNKGDGELYLSWQRDPSNFKQAALFLTESRSDI